MKFDQALVVYKPITSSASGRKKQVAGQELHLKTLDMLYPLLRKLGISFGTCSVKQIHTVKDVDLVITVGGDGTVLRTSHFVEDIPILGIKSYGLESIGYFCAASTNTMNLYLKSVLTGHIQPKKLNRLEIKIDNYRAKELALNDILFSHAMPASMTCYKLTVGKRSEVQRSSGIWVSSAAGSTAAVTAAGGRPLPLGARKMEYIVREPYAPTMHYNLVCGTVPDKTPIRIDSMTQHGIIYIDGSHIHYPAPEGARITIRGSKSPLKIFWKK